MKNDRLSYWCIDATRQIRYGPDRERVYGELRLHVEDRKESFLAQGLSEEEAIDKTMEAMGKAEEVAPLLGQIHSPFWGYLLRACRIVLILLLCISVLSVWVYYGNLDMQKPILVGFDIYDSASYGGDTGRTLYHLSQPNTSFSAKGNTFTATDAAIFTISDSGVPMLFVEIQQTSLLPIKEHSAYYLYGSVNSYFSAVDSLGNYYVNYTENRYEESLRLNAKSGQSGVFTYTHAFWINDFPSDAQWVEICYERDGNSYRLRIDLTGGDRP